MRRSTIPVLVLVATLLGILAPLSPSRSAAQQATPVAACPDMTAEDNKAVVNRFLDAISSGDAAAVAGLAAQGITYHSPSKGEREGDAQGFLRGQRVSFPDATMKVDLLVAEGETVAAYVSWSGTLRGEAAMVSGQQVSIPESQRDSAWVGAVFFRVECGKIAEVWPVVDQLGRLMDLGVITPEDLRSADVIATPQP